MIRNFIGITLQFAFAVTGIVLLGCLPVLMDGNGISAFFHKTVDIAAGLLRPWEIAYVSGDVDVKLFPEFTDAIIYSFTLMGFAFLAALTVSIVLTVLTMLLPLAVKERVKLFVYMTESIPDILVILLLQLFVITIYKQTGIKLTTVISIMDSKPYVLPIICLSVLPTIQLYRLSIYLFEEELRKDYPLFAASVGLKKAFIFIVHILRNILVSLFYQSKTTIWFMLSNLLVLEHLFNIFGITHYVLKYMSPEVFTTALLALFIPIFLFYKFGELLLENTVGRGEGI
ncbi:ABC transporter permease subunit [Bacillus lacus]|uniref:ABC transporter permease subunit n=1 Tax=Metabacillus lacus TaxID=1983721 RepID=A0A7X2IWL5_9BACI|nr:ABC transporter permease subunit [Metabacillus lacus]MRX71163.1 ABC transporter permease subunit [Metabacillus lacus]